MRFFFTPLSLLVAIMLCAACAPIPTTTPIAIPAPAGEAAPEVANSELAMIIAASNIDDASFNQTIWQSIQAYAQENKKTYQHYDHETGNTDELVKNIDLAIKNGAKLVIGSGYFLGPAIFIAQDRYPDISFLVIDEVPRDGTSSTVKIAENSLALAYADEESGFLAGYAAVKDGYRKLGFMGAKGTEPMPAIIRYGYGFVQGAHYAAQEMGLEQDSVEMRYTYIGDFNPSPEIEALATSWFQEGTEVIFTCGGDMAASTIAAAEAQNGKIIGVDTDQSGLSEVIITSATKALGASVLNAVEQFYDGTFQGGRCLTLGAKQNGVGLPQDFSRMKQFNKQDYDAIYAKLTACEIALVKNKAADGTTDVLLNELPVPLLKLLPQRS